MDLIQNKPGPGYSPKFPTPPVPLPTIPEILHSATRSILDKPDMKNPMHKSVRVGRDGSIESTRTRVHSHFQVVFGPYIKLSDAYAAHFVSQNTTIPVPKTYAVLYDPETKFTFIIYEYLEDATSLTSVWECDKKFQNKCIATIAGYIKQLRSIPSPGWFGTVDGKLIMDPYAWGTDFDPYKKEPPPACSTAYGWVQTLLNTMEATHPIGPTHKKWLTEMMHAALDPSSGPEQAVFTHPNLDIDNTFAWRHSDQTIIWKGWFGAGFAPKYWQYCTTMASLPLRWVDDQAVIWHRILEPFALEFAWIDKYCDWFRHGYKYEVEEEHPEIVLENESLLKYTYEEIMNLEI